MNTRILPVPWSLRTGPKRGSHLVPNVLGTDVATFVDLRAFRTYSTGLLVYLGKDVGIPEIAARIASKVQNFHLTEFHRKVLERYIAELQAFKIGNVVEIVPDDEGLPHLILIKESGLSGSSLNLP